MILRTISIFFAAIIFLAYSSIFVVDERQKALVLQFGQVRDVKEDPGLAFKLPFIQQVVRYDDRILSLDTMPLEVTPLDDRRLVVDAFARYRIINVVQFRQAVGTGGILTAEGRLERILNAALREVLGSVNSNAVLSADRIELMTRITDAAKTESKENPIPPRIASNGITKRKLFNIKYEKRYYKGVGII